MSEQREFIPSTILRQNERLLEVFPDIVESNKTIKDLLDGSTYFSGIHDCIVVVPVGSVEFYLYAKKNTIFRKFNAYVSVPIQLVHEELLYVEEIPLEEMIREYIVNGKKPYGRILSAIFHREKNHQKELNEEKELNDKILQIKRELYKNGKVKVDEEYLEFFEDFRIDKEGYHVI